MEEQDNIGKLFREKLGGAEVNPSDAAGSELMRRVGRKEFLRFNPTRINIYYISILLIALAAALILISDLSHSKGTRPGMPVKDLNQVPYQDSSVNPSQKSSEIKAPGNVPAYNRKQDTGRNFNNEAEQLIINPQENRKTGGEYEINRSPVRNIFPMRELFKGKSADRNELQGEITLPDGLIEASAEEGCIPLRIKFGCSQGYDSYQWSFGDGGYSEARDPEWIFDNEGEYKVRLTVRRSDGIRLTSYTRIMVYSKPIARFEIRQAAEAQNDNEVKFINYSINAARFRWYFGDGSSSELFEPGYRYSKSGNYNVMLVASSDYGCTDSLVIENAFSGYNYFINFPNAFIPNKGGPTGGYYSTKSDETAEVFHPVFFGVSEYELRIYSKIGILIFETNDINVGWDGYFKGQLSEPGVYVWKVRGTFMNGEQFIKSGDITLLKTE